MKVRFKLLVFKFPQHFPIEVVSVFDIFSNKLLSVFERHALDCGLSSSSGWTAGGRWVGVIQFEGVGNLLGLGICSVEEVARLGMFRKTLLFWAQFWV